MFFPEKFTSEEKDSDQFFVAFTLNTKSIALQHVN